MRKMIVLFSLKVHKNIVLVEVNVMNSSRYAVIRIKRYTCIK